MNATQLVQDLSGPVFRLILRMTGDREEARDLTQEVLVKVLRASARQKLVSPKAYALRSAWHAALNSLRNRSRRKTAVESLRLSQPETGDGPDTVGAPDREILRRAVLNLAEKQRETVALRFFSEMSIAEIAAALGVAEGTVKVHLARGLANLKRALVSSGQEEKS